MSQQLSTLYKMAKKLIFVWHRYKGMILQHRVRALCEKRPQLDFDREIYHQENAASHTTADTILDIELLGFELLKHHAY